MKTRKRNSKESGQAVMIMLLVLGIFLLGTLAFAVDMGFLWWHRQTAQTAADAACIAGAMNLLVYNQSPGGSSLFPWVTAGGGVSCNGHTSFNSTGYGPCQYAALNGYDSNQTTPGNDVYLSFPTSLPGVATTPPSTLAPVPFMRVDVLDHVQTFFWGLLSGKTSSNVRAVAKCGAVQVNAPVPILVLKPTGSSTFNLNGGGTVTIMGGPSQSIQVNSSDPGAVNASGGSGQINLKQAGPNNDGADFGVWGGPASTPSTMQCGTADPNCYKPNNPPINDPFAALPVPQCGTTVKGAPSDSLSCTTAATVTYGIKGVSSWGCPDTTAGCDHYTPGYYPSGILVKKGKNADGSNNGSATGLAVFEPGVYYLAGSNGMSADSNSCIRPGTTTSVGQTNIGGTVFYFAGSGTLNIGANSGKTTSGNPCGSATITNFLPTSGGPTGLGVKCTAGSTIPGGLPNFTGNVLLAPCTATYGDQTLATTGSVDPKIGQQRGILFFQNRAQQNLNPSYGGGGTYIAAGTLYFHACNSSGTGFGCTYNSDTLTISGNSASSTYTFGDIVTDSLTVQGGGTITMELNTSVTFGILKASLFQ